MKEASPNEDNKYFTVPIITKHRESSDSQRWKVKWWLPGTRVGRERTGSCVMGTKLEFSKTKKFWRPFAQQCEYM